MAAFKAYRSTSKLVLVRSKSKDAWKSLPSSVKKAFNSEEAGKYLPKLVVTQPDGQAVVQVTGYTELKADARKKARELKKTELVSKSGISDEGSDDFQTWTNTDGKAITAQLLSCTSETATFKMEDGRELDYPLAQLNEASRKRARASQISPQ